MLFGLDGVELGLIIVFLCLFGAIMSGFPVAFAIGGAAMISFGIIALLDANGLLLKEVIDTSSEAYGQLANSGIIEASISRFRYPDLPTVTQPLFDGGLQAVLNNPISFIANRMNERVIAGQSIETLLAVAMFVLMGITLERSRIAEDLLTTMGRVFGPLPGGLAVSVVVVGAFLAASTGIVGATVVTMGLLTLPTMLRNGYSPELSTGVIAASGTLGQIIPPSIVIVLLGTLTGDLYSSAQEARAVLAGCRSALEYLGEAAVLSVGTLFQSAILPGILLAVLYGVYAFGYALLNPEKAPPIKSLGTTGPFRSRGHKLTWFLAVPVGIIAMAIASISLNVVGSQDVTVSSMTELELTPGLRTNVTEQCQTSMIELHGLEAWEEAVAINEEIMANGGGGTQEERQRSPEEIEQIRAEMVSSAAPISTGLMVLLVMAGLTLALAVGVDPSARKRGVMIGAAGIALSILFDILFVNPLSSPGAKFLIHALPFAIILYGMASAIRMLSHSEVLRVVFPPLVLIVAVLGSILGGITNPTPAAALGAGGAIMLAAYRKLREEDGNSKVILIASFAMVIMLLIGINFDLRAGIEQVGFQNWVAIIFALICYHIAVGGLLFACWVLWRRSVLTPVVQETAKVTSMVFAILIGSQMLNLVIISFGGEHYIQQFLRSFDNEIAAFLIVMVVLFVLGFVLDFLEIIYIVIPIVGPVIYGGSLDPSWVTIMIAVNLQTSFLTPPFGFALFYLRGVAPPSVTTGHIYRGVVPFVIIQIVGLLLLFLFPGVVTLVPSLLPGGG